MLKLFTRYAVMLTLIGLTGCVGAVNQGGPSGGGQQGAGPVIEVPHRKFVDKTNIPADAELVMAAIINAMRGGGEIIPNVGFDPEGTHGFFDDPFTFDTFDVEFVDVNYFKTERPLDRVRYALLEGGFYLTDPIGRSAYVWFKADYAVSGQDIIITRTEYDILTGSHPEIKAFILPRAVFDAIPVSVRNDFAALYLLASQNAVSMTPTADEKIRHEQYEQLSFMQRMKYESASEPDSYCVLVFCMERLNPDSRFVVTVSGSESPGGKSSADVHYMSDKAWVVALAAGKFALDAYDSEVFFHVAFNPGTDPDNAELEPIARFSSLKNYHADQKKEPVNPYLEDLKQQGIAPAVSGQDTTAASNEGPISSGKVFLNPADVDDAKIIQQRLADFGYYTMKIDGAFGKGSRGALKAFKTAVGLGRDSTWDMDTQKALFKGSGL